MVLTRLGCRLAVAGVVAALCPRAAAGEQFTPASIFGRVELTRDHAAPPRPQVSALGMGPAQDANERRKVVVYLEEAPRRAFEEPDRGRVVLDQRHQAFIPRVLAITVGTTVDFLNSDRIYHNVFSLSKPRPFDLGRYPRGRSKSVRFDHPGVVRIFCDIHSNMSAFILVFAHRYFAVTDNDGAYRIDGVPPGTYTVVAWHEGEARGSRTVEVPAGGAVELDFSLR